MIEINCSQCGKDLQVVKHITKCECGSRIKVLDFNDHKLSREELKQVLDYRGDILKDLYFERSEHFWARQLE